MKYTRAIINAIHNGELEKAEFEETEVFKLMIPKGVTKVPSEILDPSKSWANKEEFKTALNVLASEFRKNFDKYKSDNSARLLEGGPVLPAK